MQHQRRATSLAVEAVTLSSASQQRGRQSDAEALKSQTVSGEELDGGGKFLTDTLWSRRSGKPADSLPIPVEDKLDSTHDETMERLVSECAEACRAGLADASGGLSPLQEALKCLNALVGESRSDLGMCIFCIWVLFRILAFRIPMSLCIQCSSVPWIQDYAL